MDANISDALLVASLSVGIGGLLGYFLFVKTIDKWYASERAISTHAKIKYWCGALSMITFTQGAITVIRELLYALFTSLQVKVDNLAKGIIVIVVYPLLFAFVAFVLTRFIKEKNKDRQQAEVQASNLTAVESPSANVKDSSKSIFIVVLGVAVLILLAMQLMPLMNVKEKTFYYESCTSCNNNGCKPNVSWTKFTVSPPNIILYGLTNEGETGITFPDEITGNCVINKDRNFSFECEKAKIFSELVKSTSFMYFDGKNSFVKGIDSKLGEATISSKISCQVK